MNPKLATAYRAALLVFVMLECVLSANALYEGKWLDLGLSLTFLIVFAIALKTEYDEAKAEKLA